jgi:hypothetical protein
LKIKEILKLPVAKSITFYGIRKFSTTENVKKHIQKTDKKRVLILRDISEPVELTKHLYKHITNEYEVLLISIGDGSNLYSKINYSNLRNYVDKHSYMSFQKYGKIFSSHWNHLKKDRNFKDTLSFKGINLWSVVQNLFLFYYNVRFQEIVFLIEIVNNIIKIEKPDLIILFDDVGVFGKTIANVCKTKKIPCLTLQHGTFGDLPIQGVVSDKFAAYGNFSKKILEKNGVDPKKIVVTGNPKFDIILNKKYSKKDFYKKFKIPKDNKLIVFATSFFRGEFYENIVSSLFNCVKKFDKVKLLIKQQPSEETVTPYMVLAKKIGIDVIIVQKYDLFEILYASDVLITTSSTVGLEAMVFNKPVVNIHLANSEEPIPYSKSKAAIGVSNLLDLNSAIHNALHNRKFLKKLESNRKKFLYEHAFKLDGNSTQRILLLIKKMIN